RAPPVRNIDPGQPARTERPSAAGLGLGHGRGPRRDRAAGAVVGDVDHRPSQPRPDEPGRGQGRRAPVVLGLDDRDHDRPVVFDSALDRPGLGQTPRLAGAPRDQLPARRPRRRPPRHAALVRRPPALPVPDEGSGHRRLLHRFGGHRRDRPDLGRTVPPLRLRPLPRDTSGRALLLPARRCGDGRGSRVGGDHRSGGAHARRDRVDRRPQPAVARPSHPRCADQAAPGHVRSRRLAGAHLPLAAPARSGLRRPRRAGARGSAREDDQPRVPAAAARPPERGPRPSARRPVRDRGGRAAGRDRAAPAAGRPRDPHRRRGARRARLHPKAVISSQVALGRFLSDLKHVSPEVAHRVVTVSPDVATSTNLGGWINKTGIWSPAGREDWFSDDRERVLRWQEGAGGQHIELGIAEINLVSLASELGSTGSRWGQPLLPIATIYDPFINRALEPWTFSLYAGGRSIMVGTPSGVTLAPEGGAHQSFNTPSVTLEIPGLTSWEPAFAQDLEWTLLEALRELADPDGESAYFRLTTRPVEQELAAVPADGLLRARRREQVIAGGYRLSARPAADDEVTLVGAGAIMTEVIEAAARLESLGVRAGIVCLSSPAKIFRAVQERSKVSASSRSAIADELFPAAHPAPLVTVLDGHPHTLAFLAGVRGDRIRNLGVSDFGQASSVSQAHAIHGIDAASIVGSALDLVGR